MANFSPKWDLVLDSTTIIEGQSTYARLRLSKQSNTDVSSDYNLNSNQYLQISYTINLNGDTVQERDYNVNVGESTSTLLPIANAGTGNNKINGTHVVKFNKKQFHLSTSYLDTYFIEIVCPKDGIWDSSQNVTVTLNSVQVYEVEDSQIVSISSSGIIGTSKITLQYDNTFDSWVTPDLITHQKNLYTVGEIAYGSESRIFIQAYGFSGTADDDNDPYPLDTSTRVFVPTYKLVDMNINDIPSTHITGSGTILVPQSTNLTSEEGAVLVRDNIGNLVDSGLKFNANGQFLQSLLYDSEPIDAYFKAQIVSLDDYYNTNNPPFFEGKRFKAYQMWIAPSDVSIFTETSRPLPGHLYQLKDTKIYPYVAKSEVYQGETKLVFDPEVWNDLGVYSNKLGESIIGLQKMFRMVLNNNDSAGISFDTDPNLGIIHVGEYFGHSRYPKISASGADLITYTLSSDSRDDITKYNLNLTADGYMVGTAYCKTSDFDANDEVQLKFNVIATTSKGSSIKQEFQLTIIPGFGQNYISSELKMSTAFERAYFKCISSKQFNNYKYYRESDPHYGRKTVPSILLKENFVNPTLQWTDIKDVKSRLRDGIIDTVNGSVIPDSTFQYVVGNYKVITAVDNNGNELYDVLYREMLPFGSNPKPEEDPRQYNVQDYFTLTEVYGIRQNIYNVLGEDVKNLNTDPDDFANRAVSVPELDSVTVAMVDTVPRFMAHAMTENGVKNGYRPMMVVAYCNAGEGDLLFDNLVTSSEYKNMLGEIIEVQYVNFKYFSEEDGKYVQQNFAIPIPFKTLIA